MQGVLVLVSQQITSAEAAEITKGRKLFLRTKFDYKKNSVASDDMLHFGKLTNKRHWGLYSTAFGRQLSEDLLVSNLI